MQFTSLGMNKGGQQHFVMKITVDSEVKTEEPAQDLATTMQDAARAHGDGFQTTVWLDVTGLTMPMFVPDAIERCAGFGLGLIVTHAQCCSHQPGFPLPERVMEHLERCQRHGFVWHPSIDQLVPADPAAGAKATE